MSRAKTGLILLAFAVISFSGILFVSCGKNSFDGMVIFTEIAIKSGEHDNYEALSGRYIPGSRIAIMDPANPNRPPRILTSGFYAARSPEVSCDGKHLLFAAQQKEDDTWQIWEMNLSSGKARQITASKDNCTDPAYLPLGQFVFSRSLRNDSVKSDHSLFAGNLDGSGIKRLTYNPHTYVASTVLMDGRILSLSRRLYPDAGNEELMVMRPDGTKYELFYKGTAGTKVAGRCWETPESRILFIESDSKAQRDGDIISVNYNRPLHSAENLTSGIQGVFRSAFPEQSGKLLVTYRKSGGDSFGLYELDPGKKELGAALYNNGGYDVLEAVEARVHQRTRKLPSEVNMVIKTGLIVCQDVNHTGRELAADFNSLPKTSAIEIIGVDSSMGIVEPEKDGSFYLKILADKPFRIRSLDKDGKVTGECDWLWLRPNERRGCVGCHEDQEMVPENRIPMAVKKLAVSVPVHIGKIKEKHIDTE